eukprot:7478686-Pyramimonas_sp.AAC.1
MDSQGLDASRGTVIMLTLHVCLVRLPNEIWCARSCRQRRCAWHAWHRKEAANHLGRHIIHAYGTLMDDGLQKP